MDSYEQTSRRRFSSGQLSYPNHSLGDMASMSNVNILHREAQKDDSSDSQRSQQGAGLIRQTILVTCLMLGFLFSNIDTCIVSIPLVTISLEFENFAHAPWVIMSYLLTYMACAVGIAQLSDVYGRRNTLMLSWLIFIVFSLGCGMSQSMTALIVCRAFQGIGGSGLYSLTQISIVEIGPGHRPGLVGALMGGTLAIAFICGPLLGGLITETITWRWIFNINLPIGIPVMAILAVCWPPEPQAPSLFSWSAFTTIDFIGAITLFLGSGFLVLSIHQAGTRVEGWNNPWIISAAALACVMWAAFLAWEVFLSQKRGSRIRPLFTMRLATERVYMAGLLVTFLTGFPFVPLSVIIPERFQIIHGEQPLTAGVHLLPMLGACAVGSFLSGAICRNRNHTFGILISATALQLLGLTLMTTLRDPDADVRTSYVFQSIFGVGTGLVFSAATILAVVKSTVEKNDLAIANGAMAQARVLGGCIGISICSFISNDHFNRLLRDNLTAEQFVELYRAPTTAVQWSGDVRDQVRDAYAAAYAAEMTAMMYIAVLMFLASFLTWEQNPTPIHHAVAAAKQRLQRESGTEIELTDLGAHRAA